MFERYGGVTPTDGGDCYITQVRELAMTGFWLVGAMMGEADLLEGGDEFTSRNSSIPPMELGPPRCTPKEA
jgi:hypothetical protein